MLDIEGATWIIYPSILIVLVLIAYYVVQTFRNLAIGGAPASDDHLGTFREMRDKGMIAPEEYKKVAGLVPLPEIDSKKTEAIDTGADALSEAAKAAIRKAASKNSEESESNEKDFETEEGEESTES